MSELLIKQARLRHTIERSLDNFRKIGKAKLTPATTRSRIVTLKEAWASFQDGHDRLLTMLPSASLSSSVYFGENVFETVEEVYWATHDAMTEHLESVEPVVSASQAVLDTTMPRSEAAAISLSHLPPIKLPPFDGNYADWEAFRDRFSALIISNKSLTDFSRMHYLASSLKGRALESISHIAVTADNFTIAWAALTQRFENKRRLLGIHFSQLLGSSDVAKESASEMQTLLDKFSIAIASLTALKRSPAELWDDFLVHLLSQKIDPSTRKAWHIKTSDAESPPTFSQLSTFLSTRVRAFETTTLNPKSTASRDSKQSTSRACSATASTATQPACPLCKARHFVNACSKFTAQTPNQRRETIKSLKRCFNCLSNSHSVSDCKSRFSCRSCGQKHHSMLHADSEPEPVLAVSIAKETPPQTQAAIAPPVASHSAFAKPRSRSQILLATALVRVESPSGRSAVVRAMLDQGSQISFVSESLAQSLRAQRISMPMAISGVGCVPAGTARQAATFQLAPVTPTSSAVSATALILPSLSSYAPRRAADPSFLSQFDDLALADPDPTGSKPIHLLIGADYYRDVILEGIRKSESGGPIAQKTIFGWVLTGPVPDKESRSTHSVSINHCVSLASLSNEIQKFWEIEELPSRPISSPLDEQCDAHFAATHTRDSSGRYMVRLPFKSLLPLKLGDSARSAERLLHSLIRRFQSQPELCQSYREFMSEYETLGHMRRVAENHRSSSQVVFIPHHPVFRADSATSRIRVVFNASHSTTNRSSLNDHLHVGPKLQADLPSVVNQWRLSRYVCTADIAKMYRQILVDPRDIDFQRIKWQSASQSEPNDYQLLTVTYGMTCAPYLAIRVLTQLAADDGHRFPLAAQIIRSSIYVDDVLFGDNDLASLRVKRDQLNSLLAGAGFELRKWASNASNLLADIDPSDHGLACNKILSDNDRVKVLGIVWSPASDAFQFRISLSSPPPNTKRSILSMIARLYDPLGWVTPAIVAAKIIMQHLWRAQVDWDDVIPDSIFPRWQSLYSHFQSLNKLSLPRWTGTQSDSISELHGFADASTQAYAAVVYLRTTAPDGRVSLSLIAGKSRVAPLSPLTVPRLELSAAVLLVRLLQFVRDSLAMSTAPCIAWTDSTIALAWIRSHPSRWTTFVANRVAFIQTTLPEVVWRHVPTDHNPADCASRGLSGDDLLAHHLWWKGPPWLIAPSDEWPGEPAVSCLDHPGEERARACHVAAPPAPWELASRFSSWSKLIRVTAYLYKFINSSRRLPRPSDSPPAGRALSSAEFRRAKLFWLKQVQVESFSDEFRALQAGRHLPKNSSIIPMSPFVDDDGLIRVGGRLRLAPLPYDVRHPILLADHPLTRLLISHTHIRTLHGRMQMTLSVLRKEFWILRARTLVKSLIHRCITCVRERAAVPIQLMGTLPSVRVTPPPRSFANCGLDYAGPIKIRASAGRGIKSFKAYIALFICLATRAIHLELVGDYSTAAFLQALNRFCARRGLPQSIYSDNGTNFVGADRELSSAYRAALRDPALLNSTAGDGICWHFIPPSAPHFGGLWEAGVKSVKHHLRRVLGDRTLSFEEMTTLLCQIEAILNSRPLAPLSDDFDDHRFLTPGHFLIGSPLTVPPEPSTLNLNENRLSRWQLVRQIFERFWRLWSSDYVNTLQQRQKWRFPQPPISVGRIVLLRNSLLPPCKWELGRVTKVHPGPDGLPRVATVKTATSEYVRPIGKLCLLPIDAPDSPQSRTDIL